MCHISCSVINPRANSIPFLPIVIVRKVVLLGENPLLCNVIVLVLSIDLVERSVVV